LIAQSDQIAPPFENGATPAPSARRWAQHYLPLILILWLALFLRVWQLDVLPPGLHYDEAFKGVKARAVLSGAERPIFFTENFGEEPLQIYSTAALFTLVGESPWTIRLTSVFFGVLFVVALYACARAFFPHSVLIAQVAALIAATLYWAINFSRIGIETNSLGTLLTLSAAALGYAYRTWNWKWVVGAGVLLGATLYTYLASRIWFPAVLLWFVYLVVTQRALVRTHFSKWVVIAICAFLTALPLGLFFLLNPTAFAGRSGQVFTPETFGANLLRTAGMFLVTGDVDPRDNFPGRPALDVILFIFFAMGFIIALVRVRKPFYAFLLIWLVVMMLPSALTEFAPNMRRAIGAMPAAILLCSLGFDWLWQHISNLQSQKIWRIAFAALFIGALVLSAFWSARAYFVEWAGETGLFYSFDAGLLNVGKALAARPNGEMLYLSPKYDDHPTIQWALNGRPISSFDGRRVRVLPDSTRAATYGIITYEDTQTLDALQHAFTHAQPVESFSDLAGKPYASILTLDANTENASPEANDAPKVGDFAVLNAGQCSGETTESTGAVLVTLCWDALKSVPRDYTIFVHLIGPPNPETHSTVWAQVDEQPGGGTFPTSQWRVGQTIIENYTLKIPENAPPGEYTVEVGMYLLETGERVPLTRNGVRLPNDAVSLGSIKLK